MLDARFPLLLAERTLATSDVLRDEFDVQADVIWSRHGTGLTLLPDLYDDRLESVLFDVNSETSFRAGDRVASHFGGTFDRDLQIPWLTEGAGIRARSINDATRSAIAGLAAADLEAWLSGFGDLADLQAADLAHGALNFGAHDAAQNAGATGKVWQVNSGNPRSSHIALNGETVGMSETFSNGLRWPKDYAGSGAEEVANCKCSLRYV